MSVSGSFTRSAAAIILCLSLFSCRQPNNRRIISLNGPWKFYVDSAGDSDTADRGVIGLPALLCRTVSVPHAWNAEKGLESYRGKCWYERSFDVPAEQLSKTTRIQFDAVYHDAVIYVNGRKAGEHTGSGYTRFFVDVSPYLKQGHNTLTVSADNSPSRGSIPFAGSYDWADDGGIIRGVYEVVTQKQAVRNIHIIALPVGDKGRANISISLIDTTGAAREGIFFKALITEENQLTHKQVFSGKLPGKFEKGSFISFLRFDHIHPWHFDFPNLYKLDVRLFVNGVEKDNYTTVFGFRSIKVENNRYILNGEPVRLMGVEWMPGSTLERGMAETHADLEKNLVLMKNANCIFTRFHWQQDDYVFDWCDRHGILVQEEIPYWGGTTMINDTLLKKGLQQLDEMTDAHYNHPSVIAWGIGNELQSHDTDNIAALKILYRHAKSLDSSRLVTYVSNALNQGNPSEGKELPDATADFDMMMFNEYYTTWYGKNMDVIPGELDRIHREYPDKALTISEWGLCEPVFKGGDARRAREMVQQMNIFGTKEYIAGAVYFCLNDYRTHMGEDSTYSYPQRVHGVCDINLDPKPSYDTLKAVSSPLEIRQIEKKDRGLQVTLHGKTGLPAYTLTSLQTGTGNENVEIAELRPGMDTTLRITSYGRDIRIVRPTGFEVLRIPLME